MKKALITGITGQDGSYLAELLLEKGYEVHGTVRRSARGGTGVLPDKAADSCVLHSVDISDAFAVADLFKKNTFDEVYHLAAQSFVSHSFSNPDFTLSVNTSGTLHILEALRAYQPECKMYFAATSEMFGDSLAYPQDENTPFMPRNPYGAAKLAAYWLCNIYRKSYGLFICCGILFNHESERRGKEFVTRKITSQFREIVDGKRTKIQLGSLTPERDWGYAPDYVDAMHRMLQRPEAMDYVIATGETHSIKDFVEECFALTGLKGSWQQYVVLGGDQERKLDINKLCGRYERAKGYLAWEPKHTFKDLVRIMWEAECPS